MISINKHSSIKIEGGKILYFDPYGIDSECHDADVIFFTHSHYDHFSPADVEKIKKDTTVFVAPTSCSADLEKNGFANAVFMNAGEENDVCGIAVKAVPAYNIAKPFHPKANGWLGYVVEAGGRKIYVAGDTDALDENAEIKCDVALVPVGGMFTMNFSEAAELVNRLNPEIAVPTHYGSVTGKKTDGEDFVKLVKPEIKTEILIR